MTPRSLSLALVTAALVGAPPAAAQLPGGLPDPGTVAPPSVPATPPSPGDIVSQLPIDDVPVPGGTGTVTGALGTVGGVLSGIDPGVLDGLGGALDGVLGGTGLPLPQVPGGGGAPAPVPGPLTSLLSTLGPRAAPGTLGGPTVIGSGVVPGTNTIDARPPVIKVEVLSLLRRTGKTGRLQIRLTADEPAVAGMSGNVKPGKPRKKRFRARGFQKQISLKTAVLVFRKPGALTVTVAVARGAQRRLNRARDARLTLGLIASDVFGNQAGGRALRHVKR
jgi:hypothetical protein